MKVVCDTNVLISGILFGGNAREILQQATRGSFENHISSDILSETREVLLRPKFGLPEKQVEEVVQFLKDSFELVFPSIQVSVITSDPDDNRILEAAHAAEADFIISGDSDLLKLKQWNGIEILSPADFIAKLS